MAAPSTHCLIGPVPFKEVCPDGDDDHVAATEEYEEIVSTLPSVTSHGVLLRQYQGAWLVHERVPGVLSIQQRFTPRRGDVFLASSPKCGTTWLKALCFATMARAAYPAGAAEHPLLRLNPHECVPFLDDLFSAGQEGKLEALPSPRLVHTHMHLQLLPASVAKNPACKIIYICRDPKDMLVSLWLFVRTILSCEDFSEMFELACHGKVIDGPIWDHVLGYWRASKASPEKVMFLRYEEMLLDPVATVMALARFLGVPFSAAEEAAKSPEDIATLCSFETLKGATANKTGSTGAFFKFPHQTYFRKGVVGDWMNYMTPDMAQRFDSIVEEKLRGSGLTF